MQVASGWFVEQVCANVRQTVLLWFRIEWRSPLCAGVLCRRKSQCVPQKSLQSAAARRPAIRLMTPLSALILCSWTFPSSVAGANCRVRLSIAHWNPVADPPDSNNIRTSYQVHCSCKGSRRHISLMRTHNP